MLLYIFFEMPKPYFASLPFLPNLQSNALLKQILLLQLNQLKKLLGLDIYIQTQIEDKKHNSLYLQVHSLFFGQIRLAEIALAEERNPLKIAVLPFYPIY